jgi:preprotein translocase subunit YajC
MMVSFLIVEYVIFFIIVSGRENKQKQLKSNTLNKIKFG